MKRILIFLSLVLTAIFCQAQYNEEKLTDILTGGSTKAWSVKSANTDHAEKSYTYTFSKNLTVAVTKTDGSVQSEKWGLSSSDNIRWFITIGTQKHELIVSYDKAGNQFIKLTSQVMDKSSLYNELLLYPVK